MGLGDLLFSKKSKSSVGTNTSSVPQKKIDSNKVDIFKRGKYHEKELRGVDTRSLKKVVIDGEKFDKKVLASLVSEISKKTKRSVTKSDLEKYFANRYRNKLEISRIDRKKVLKVFDKLAKQKVGKQSGGVASITSIDKSERSARKVDAKSTLVGQRFVSPKDSKSGLESSAESSFGHLGIESVKSTIVGGRGSVSGSRSRSVEKKQSVGMVQSGSSNLTRKASSPIGGSNSLNLSRLK